MSEEEKAEKKRQDADLLANSILNHQANSITQVRKKRKINAGYMMHAPVRAHST